MKEKLTIVKVGGAVVEDEKDIRFLCMVEAVGLRR